MKRLLAGILTILLALCAFLPYALAEETNAPVTVSPEPAAEEPVPLADPASDEPVVQIVRLTVDTVSATGGEARVALSIENGNGVDSLECNLNYDAAAMKVVRVEPGVTFPAEYCITNTNEAGRVRLATACALGLDNEQGAVIILHVKLTGDKGSAITLSDVRVTTVGAEYVQSKAYVGVTDGGVTSGGGALPQSLTTPWIPETPVPPATPTPVPTEAPAPEVLATPAPVDTPEPSPEPAPESPAMLPYVLAGVIAILLAAGIVILLVSSSNSKKRKKRKKKSSGKAR